MSYAKRNHILKESYAEDKNSFALSHGGGAEYLIKFSCALADEKYEWMR